MTVRRTRRVRDLHGHASWSSGHNFAGSVSLVRASSTGVEACWFSSTAARRLAKQLLDEADAADADAREYIERRRAAGGGR